MGGTAGIFRLHRAGLSPLYFGRTGDNRFDAPDGTFGVLYAGEDEYCCFSETCGQTTGIASVSGAYLDERHLAEMKLTAPMSLIDLATSGGLARIGADGRLMDGSHAVAQRWSAACASTHPSRMGFITGHGMIRPNWQTDGYNHVGGPKMVHPCCLAQARRKYVDAVKVNANDQESARIVALMDELFAIDRNAREQNLDHAQRDLLRQERAPKLLEKLRVAALALKKTALPKSAAGQAANYTLSFWSKLTVFLKHPELELSTNLAENAMRSIAIGRKNWLHRGSKEAGPKIAAIFSVVESCRRLNIPTRKYLNDVLPGLANRSIQSLAELTPTACASRMAD